MRRRLTLVGLLACLGLAGCATMTSPPPARLVAEHRQRALTLESRGDLRAALEEWKIVLTIDPTSATARAELARLSRRRQGAVARRIQAGQDALRRSSHGEARRQLLAALALDPSNVTAFTALREQVPEIPEVVGTPKLLEGHPLLADAREALDRREYRTALAAVDRLLEGNPKNTEWRDLKKTILYGQGKEALASGRYDDAYRALSQLARLDPAYRNGARLLQDARNHAIQLHYNEGIRLSRDEQLEAAIAHWHAVLEHDPQHAEARRNIEQARRILRSLEEQAKQ